MELNITKFFREACAKDYSASIAEIGSNAGADTWRAANDDSAEYPILDTDEKREAFRDFVGESGGWDESEIASWTDIELNALCIQWIAGDIRESGLDTGTTWPEYEKMAEKGQVSSRIFKGVDGQIYFYCGS